MKATKRLITWLLALAMVFSLLPMPARAEETAPETTPEAAPAVQSAYEELPVQVNPLYKDLYTPEDFDLPDVHMDPQAAAPLGTTYLTVEKGAEELRKHMKNREETFVVYVESMSPKLQPICDEMLELALVHTGKPTEGDYLMWQYGTWQASSRKTWNNATKTYSYDITFTMTYYTSADQETEMSTAVNNLINALGVRYKSDYEKICAVYDWICANVTYDYENLEDDNYTLKHSAYAALVNKTAVCQGYALLFYRLMLELGVDSRLIAGLTGAGEAHGWNIVEIDGLYYDLDSTWDAGMDEYSFFLCCDEQFYDHYRYMDYATLDFLTSYPMSAKNYVHGEASEPLDVLFAGQCGDDAYWQIDMDRELTIQGTGAIYDYPYSAVAERLPPWHYWEEELYSLVVEEGITVLGDYTFCDQINLTSVTLPSTLTEIRARAFIGCEKLPSITIPEGVTYIDGAFEECGLTSITIPDSVQELGIGCFRDCKDLKTAVLGSGISEIESSLFEGCSSLTAVTLPNSITNIGDSAFYGCSSLKEITIPAGVESMGRESLSGCGKLEKVIFKGKTDLTRGVFSQYNTSMKTVYFYGAAPQFAFNTFMGLTVTCYYPKGSPSWTEEVRQQYGGTVTWVGMNVDCVEHQYETVVTDPTCSQRGYTTYTCAVCGESYVGDYTDPVPHSYDEGVVTAPTCTEQGYTTYTCTVCGESHVGDYTDPVPHSYDEGVVTNPTCQQGGYTTYACTICGNSYVADYTDPVDHSYENGECIWCGESDSLPYGTWGDNITWVFDEETGTLTFTGSGEMKRTEYVFDYPWYYFAENVTSVVIDDGITNVPEYAFYTYANLETVALGKNVKTLEPLAFMECFSLTQINLPEGLETIGHNCFTSTGLTQIEIPETVTAIDSGAFSQSKLTSISVPGSVSLDMSVFHLCWDLKTVELQEGITKLPMGLFGNCPALETVYIPGSVTFIDMGVFSMCESLTSIYFTGNFVTGLADWVFYDMTLTAYYPANNATWTEDKLQNYGGTITWIPYGETEEETLVKWYSGTTSLNGTIDLNIYVLLSENLVNADDTYVRFTYADKVVDVPMAEALYSPTGDYTNRYRFSCPIYAKQLADSVNVKFMRGEEMLGTELNYSVKQYCENQIKKSPDAKLVALCKALLNYGAAAQQLLNYNTENLANASLSDADKVLYDVDASDYKYSVTGSEDGIKAKSATLMLEDVVKVRVYFTLTGDKPIEDYTITIDGKEVTPSYNEKGWYVETDGIPGKDLEKMFKVQVGGITVEYGALSFVNSKVGGSNALESNISKALYAYWQAAEALLG